NCRQGYRTGDPCRSGAGLLPAARYQRLLLCARAIAMSRPARHGSTRSACLAVDAARGRCRIRQIAARSGRSNRKGRIDRASIQRRADREEVKYATLFSKLVVPPAARRSGASSRDGKCAKQLGRAIATPTRKRLGGSMLDGESLADILTVGDITRHHAKIRPDRVAIHFEGRHTTYRELDRRANRVANGLIADGVRPQARIAYLAKNSPAFFDLWFGAAKADVVPVPINFRLAPPEVTYVVDDAGADILFVSADFYPLVEKVAG